MDSPRGSRTASSGCWTCRLRRKKCDGKQPVCDVCTGLYITCHYGQDKPEWMDGGIKQEEMAEHVKAEVKENAHRRRGVRTGQGASPEEPVKKPPDTYTTKIISEVSPVAQQNEAHCVFTNAIDREGIALERFDTILLTFYLEHLLPFQFPFYRPSLLHGGRAWILDLMISSALFRKAALCQSSYFFSLSQGSGRDDVAWETVLTETSNAFGVLGEALQIIDRSGFSEHLHCAVRIMTSIMLLQRFEIAVLSFKNCQAHLSAALVLFKQLLDNPGIVDMSGPLSNFNAVIRSLGPSSWILPPTCPRFPSAEQAAFRFSSTLLVLDDIIASTVLQERPKLYEYHHCFLGDISPTNLESTIGCQNWVLLNIGEIAALDAWKQQCRRSGNLDVMELVRRASVVKESLVFRLRSLENHPLTTPQKGSSLLDVFMADYNQQSNMIANQSSVASRIWAHAALLYLFVVVSGWQPASVDVRYHVERIIDLLTREISPPALLRTMVWPFCVAGCLAEPSQEAQLRSMVGALQPPSVFGTVGKALEIMENVWRNRNVGDVSSRDLATCFRSQGDLVLLV